MTTRRCFRLLTLLFTLLLFAAACSSSDDDSDDASSATSSAEESTTTTEAGPVEPATLDVTSTDYAYTVDTASVPAGLVTVNQQNDGDEFHQVTMIRLEDGQTAPDLADAIATEGETAASTDAYAGGPNATAPGESGAATVDLTEGSYALICFIPAQDGESHLQKGMVGQVDVTAAEGAAAEPPSTDATVTLSDFAFETSSDFSGQGTVKVVNDGEQVHEWTVSNADNTTGTGLAAIAPGATAYVPIDLADDDYVFNCFVTDPDSGQPHFLLGMTAEVSLPGGGGGGGGGSGGGTTTTAAG